MLQAGRDRIDDLFQLGNQLILAHTPTHIPAYDFDFRRFFEAHSYISDTSLPVVLRTGAIHHYEAISQLIQEQGLALINPVDAHERAALLPSWYPLIRDLTPASKWYDRPPAAGILLQDFSWPVFIKGERQTNRHQLHLSVARNEAEYHAIASTWHNDPVLGWQRMICREYIPLEKLSAHADATQLPVSLEIRVFLWRGRMISMAPYWPGTFSHVVSMQDRNAVIQLAELAARRVEVPFLVVDAAKTADGNWIIIELNDAQESGYAGNAPFSLWSALLGPHH